MLRCQALASSFVVVDLSKLAWQQDSQVRFLLFHFS